MGVPDPDIFYEIEGNLVITNVYEGLVQYANNSTQIVPALATSWTISPDGMTYTFQLRPNVMFHDGSGPMTSKDVAASFMRRTALGSTSPPGYMLADVASYDTSNPQVLVIHLKRPVAPFMDYLAAPYGPKVEDAAGLAAHAGIRHGPDLVQDARPRDRGVHDHRLRGRRPLHADLVPPVVGRGAAGDGDPHLDPPRHLHPAA